MLETCSKAETLLQATNLSTLARYNNTSRALCGKPTAKRLDSTAGNQNCLFQYENTTRFLCRNPPVRKESDGESEKQLDRSLWSNTTPASLLRKSLERYPCINQPITGQNMAFLKPQAVIPQCKPLSGVL